MSFRGYRAWDKKAEKYVCVLSLANDGSAQVAEYTTPGKVKPVVYWLDPHEVILEQYTGFKDKNDKEICEGDIVEYDWYIVGDKPAYRVRAVIKFDDLGARLEYNHDTSLVRDCTRVEAIGNIHENPELLGGENE